MSPIMCYLQSGKLPPDGGEARNIRTKVAKYTLLSEKLYKIGKATHELRCLDKNDITLVLAKVHKGAYCSHISRKAFTHNLLRVGNYWPTLMKDSITFVNKCDQCQRHVDLNHAPTKFL